MKVQVNRTHTRLNPDYTKVIPRFFNTGDERSEILITRVYHMPEKMAAALIEEVFNEFSKRHKDIEAVFLQHFEQVRHLPLEEHLSGLSLNKKLLIGAYFTMEYAVEGAALFNPSIVEAPDQSGIKPGEKKVIISFRATGESHISSIVFRTGLLDSQGELHLDPPGGYACEGKVKHPGKDKKGAFRELLQQMELPEDIRPNILNQLHDSFTYKEMETVLKNSLKKIKSASGKKKVKYDIMSLVNISYELEFDEQSRLSERVIFPVTFTEKNGIEDARFVRFTEKDGSVRYIATYTAYDGSFILPQLIETNDFRYFKVSPLHGKVAINKNLALFPRRINGKYAMISRIDGVNNYIMFSNDLYLWEKARLLQTPRYPWEYVQIGNGGSPIETEKGWLIITHGVGPMRKYCLGASLFDLNDPTIELGRLKEPILIPVDDESNGYVPNVVYTCGAMVHNDLLFLPYAVSDHASSFATILLPELLDAILESSKVEAAGTI